MSAQSIRHQLRHRTLDAFRIVYETGSATRAARRLDLTQPAISQAIAGLERSVGRSLFDRGAGRPLTPTREAEAIYPAVCRALAALSEVEAMVDAMRMVGARLLRIGAVPALAAGFAADVVARTSGAVADIEVVLQTFTPRALEQAVAMGDADLGLSFLPSVHDDVESAMLFAVDAEVVVAPSHRLAGAAVLRPRDLVGEVVLFVRGGAVPRARIEAAFDADGASRPAPMEVASEAALLELAADGTGVGFRAPTGAGEGGPPAVAARPFRPALSLAVRLLTRRGARASPAARQFVDAARRRGAAIAAAQAATASMPATADPRQRAGIAG